ncbi:hypothetical protein AABC73_06880 [Pseudomonas sp. G.S.17]|uniref:hypothetical protein n=1 Tax=Pseudomonas sp. G.S.17 TaxID=3137451 RepID=UPI00311CE04C
MSQPKNTTAPPLTQLPAIQDDDLRGFIYYQVNVRQDGIGLQGYPIIWLGLAIELLEMFRPEYPEGRLYIQKVAAELSEFDEISQSSERHKDLIFSVREAERPGHEYLARLGYFGEYDSAPQNEKQQIVARESEVSE